MRMAVASVVAVVLAFLFVILEGDLLLLLFL